MNWNNKTLAIIFFGLLAIWILNKTFNRVSETSFKSTLFQVDTAVVNKIVLYPKGIDSTSILLKRNNTKWEISNGNITTLADADRVKSILSQVSYILTKRLISKKSENQIDYEVDEQSGKLVEVYANDKLVNKIIFGRFNFNPNTRSATSYARLADDNEIYALDGMLSMSFDTDFNSFRNNEIMAVKSEDIRGVQYNGLQIQPIGEQLWGYNGTQMDSSGMIGYLHGLTNITGSNFLDNYNPAGPPDHKITLSIDNSTAPIEVQAYSKGDDFAIRSSENEAFFESDSTGIYNKIFGGLLGLMTDSDTVE